MNTRIARPLFVLGVVVLALLGLAQIMYAIDGPPILVSTERPGMTEDGISYGREDILAYYEGAWYKVFDGSEYSLSAVKHNIGAVSVPWSYDFDSWVLSETLPMVFMSFSTRGTSVPDIPVRVNPQDVVLFMLPPDRAAGGGSYSMTIDGSDIGLNLASEEIDSLSYFAVPDYVTDTIYFDYPCPFGIFAMSTKGMYVVPTEADGLGGPKEWLKGAGSDILLFCPSQLGYTTRGYWFKLFDSFEAGITPRHAIDSIAMLFISQAPPRVNSDDLVYMAEWLQTSKRPYTAPGDGGPGIAAVPSQIVYGQMLNEFDEQYSIFGMEWDMNDVYPRLNGKVDALDTMMFTR